MNWIWRAERMIQTYLSSCKPSAIAKLDAAHHRNLQIVIKTLKALHQPRLIVFMTDKKLHLLQLSITNQKLSLWHQRRLWLFLVQLETSVSSVTESGKQVNRLMKFFLFLGLNFSLSKLDVSTASAVRTSIVTNNESLPLPNANDSIQHQSARELNEVTEKTPIKGPCPLEDDAFSTPLPLAERFRRLAVWFQESNHFNPFQYFFVQGLVKYFSFYSNF